MASPGTEFGDRLRTLIFQRYDSLRAFALEIEMEPTYLSRILSGKVKTPDPPTIRRLAKGLDLAPDMLRHLTGIAEPQSDPDGLYPDDLEIQDLQKLFANPKIAATLRSVRLQEGDEAYRQTLEIIAESVGVTLRAIERGRAGK